MHVRIILNHSTLVECINRSINIGTVEEARIAGDLGAMHCYFRLLESQFNERLPLEDLRKETIDDARRSKEGGLYSDKDVRFSKSISIFFGGC